MSGKALSPWTKILNCNPVNRLSVVWPFIFAVEPGTRSSVHTCMPCAATDLILACIRVLYMHGAAVHDVLHVSHVRHAQTIWFVPCHSKGERPYMYMYMYIWQSVIRTATQDLRSWRQNIPRHTTVTGALHKLKMPDMWKVKLFKSL